MKLGLKIGYSSILLILNLKTYLILRFLCFNSIEMKTKNLNKTTHKLNIAYNYILRNNSLSRYIFFDEIHRHNNSIH